MLTKRPGHPPGLFVICCLLAPPLGELPGAHTGLRGPGPHHFEADASKWKGRRKERICSFPGSYANGGNEMQRVSSDAGSWREAPERFPLLHSSPLLITSSQAPLHQHRRGGHWPSACSACRNIADVRCTPLRQRYRFPCPLGSPSGGAAQCAHWAERARPPPL